MQKVNKIIRDNYSKYCSLIDAEKTLAQNRMALDEEKSNRTDIKEKSMPAYSEQISEDITFTVQQKKEEETDFKFILRCKPFCEQPFFRYDSTGPSHRNSNLPIPIDEQQVPTPHFHKFHVDGKEIAYKTEVLRNEKQARALEDISICIFHFLQEAHFKYDNFDLISKPGVLPFKREEEIDPLKNVEFDFE